MFVLRGKILVNIPFIRFVKLVQRLTRYQCQHLRLDPLTDNITIGFDIIILFLA